MPKQTPVAKSKKKRTRRRYSPEFKKNAVDLVLGGDTSVASVARDLGVHEKSLYEWVRAAKQVANGGLTFDEREELARLRRENRRLRQERDILKKVSVMFAKDKT